MQRILPADRDMVDRAYKNSLVTREPFQMELRILTPDGKIKWIREQCKTDFDKDGNPIKSYGYFLDISSTRLENTNIEKP